MFENIKTRIKNTCSPGKFGLVVASGITVFAFSCNQKEEKKPNIATIPKSVGVISEDFTYLRYPELKSGFEEFYDLKKDPLQINNLVDDPVYQELLEEYRMKTEEWGVKVK